MISATKYQEPISDMMKMAERLRKKFATENMAAALLVDAILLKSKYEATKLMLPSDVDSPHLERHLHFLCYYLGQGGKDDCTEDIADICRTDLPKLQESLDAWIASQLHFDPELLQKIDTLLDNHQFDSAIRKAFLVLTGRLRRSFGAPKNMDGRDLVNFVFGQKGSLAGRIDESEREAMRDLLSGLYGVFRNDFSHDDDQVPSWMDADAILSIVDWALRRLDAFPEVEPDQVVAKV